MACRRSNFIVSGHIDHGKSTFIGRLLLDIKAIPEDRLHNLKSILKPQAKLEYSHLTDSLADEKTQGITIGLSQTVFSYKKNEFVFLDAPGHHEFLQNMITGASKADLGFLIVDSAEGVKESTLRHLHMLSFLKIPQIILLINKMDLVDYSQTVFDKILTEIQLHFKNLNLKYESAIPISAYRSENLSTRSNLMPWYKGPIVTDILDQQAAKQPPINKENESFCFLVHDRYEQTLVGEVIRGQMHHEQVYSVSNSDEKLQLTADSENYQSERYQSFILNNKSSGVKRGDLVLTSDMDIQHAQQMRASVIWFGATELKVDEPIKFRLAKQEVSAKIIEVTDLIDSGSLTPAVTQSNIKKGSVFKCTISLADKVSYTEFNTQESLGRFVLLKDGRICGAGKIAQ
ncbi:MAG: GTP-binding protein [Pseudobdellovibrio sp.]